MTTAPGWASSPRPAATAFLIHEKAATTLTSSTLRATSRSGVEHRPVDRVDAGVVDEQVRARRTSRAPRDDLVLVGLVGRVAGDAEGVLRTAELLDGLSERLGLARRDDDLGALGDEALGDAEPDARGWHR